jgi:hypothetical protein
LNEVLDQKQIDCLKATVFEGLTFLKLRKKVIWQNRNEMAFSIATVTVGATLDIFVNDTRIF